MKRISAILLILCACGADERRRPPVSELWEAAADDWVTLWEILDDRYDVGDHECFRAYDAVTFFEGPHSELDKVGCGKTACTLGTFSDDVPLGSYVLGFWEGLADQWMCMALEHELIHVADNCLMENEPEWPFMVAHNSELYDDGESYEYSVELELRAMTYDDCLKGE